VTSITFLDLQNNDIRCAM